MILDCFHTTRLQYEVVFTAGATAALKLVAQAFPWSRGHSEFCHMLDNHTSVVGIREFAVPAGAHLSVVDHHFTTVFALPASAAATVAAPSPSDHLPYHLFAFPAESNFSGAQYDLNMIHQLRAGSLPGTTHHLRCGPASWPVCNAS
jgi:molybdenum cofactor sulfurtransferase